MKRACLLVISALALLLPSPAQADKHERVPPPDELLDFTFDATTVCSFELRYQELVNHETTTLLSDTQRRVNGAYKVLLTNTGTGKSLAVNASGRSSSPTLETSRWPCCQVGRSSCCFPPMRAARARS